MMDRGHVTVTPEIALRVLLARLRDFDALLVEEVQRTIDEGRLVESGVADTQSADRHLRPLDPAESVSVVIEALRARFVEAPAMADSALREFRETIALSNSGLDDVQVEIETFGPVASELRADQRDALLTPLSRIANQDLREIEDLIERIERLSLEE